MLNYAFVLPQVLNNAREGETEELAHSYSLLRNNHVLGIKDYKHHQGCEHFGIENHLIHAFIN